MRDIHLEGLLEAGLVQHRVGRAGGLRGVFRRVAGDDAAYVMSRGRGDLHREVVPRAHALVGEVVHPLVARIAPRLDQGEDRKRQVAGVGRSAHLVEDHAQRLTLRGQPQHRLQKVVPVLRIEPCRAQDQVAAPRGLHGLLARQLRTPVGPQRRGRHILRVGPVPRAVEDVVRRDVDQRRTRLLGRCREVCRGLVVEQVGCRFILLGTLHVRVGRTVDDHVDTLFLDRLKHRPGVGDVQLRDVGGQVVVGRHAPKLPQGAPQLPPGARNQDIKHSSPYCSRTVPRPPPAAGGRCPWARGRHPPAPGASRCPAWGRPTRWRPPIRGHRGCRTCIGIQPRRSAPRSRARSPAARRTAVCCPPRAPRRRAARTWASPGGCPQRRPARGPGQRAPVSTVHAPPAGSEAREERRTSTSTRCPARTARGVRACRRTAQNSSRRNNPERPRTPRVRGGRHLLFR